MAVLDEEGKHLIGKETPMPKLETDKLLHILRNPFGHSTEEIREVSLAAATEIERWKDAFENIRDWAKKNGLSITTKG